MKNLFKLHHVGYAVNSIEKALPGFKNLGLVPEGNTTEDTSRDISILFLSSQQGQRIELIEPLTENSPIGSILTKGGPAPYHLCFEVHLDNWEEGLESLKRDGFKTLIPPSEAPAIENLNVTFMYSKNHGLIEILLKE